MKNAILALSLGLPLSANAAIYFPSNVINGNGSTDALIQNANGSLNTGGFVAMGYFAAGYVVGPISSTEEMANTIAAFNIVASFNVGGISPSLSGAFPGYYEGLATPGGVITAGNPLIGRMLYVFAGNFGTLLSSDEWAIKALFPIADDVPNEQTYVGNPFGGISPVYGSFGAFSGNASGFGTSDYRTLQLALIPEPSAALLGAIGALGLLRRRRN